MTHRILPPQKILHGLLTYDPSSGELRWKIRNTGSNLKTWNTRHAGRIAGDATGKFCNISIGGKTYQKERIIWKWMTGVDIDSEILHRDLDNSNFVWDNLVAVGWHEISWAKGLRSNNTSGVKGVCYDINRNQYMSRVTMYGWTYTKRFDTLHDAEVWVKRKRQELHGEFANHG
jgi:hypothetical protein